MGHDRRGVVAEGPVGIRAAGRIHLFRYEVRRLRDGVIPDAAEAVESPQRLSEDTEHAQPLLELVPKMPTPV
jgi:phage terminase large subunit-like protein